MRAHRITKFLQSSSEDHPTLAVSAMLAGLLALSLQDSLGKILTAHISLWQFQVIRAVMNVIIVVLLVRITLQGTPFRPASWKFVMIRSVLHVCALMCFFGSAPFLSMAEMAGGLYTFPLFVAVFSALILKERVGFRRVTAISVGFIGTMLIVRPGTDSFRLVGLLPVAAGMSYALFIIVTRRYCKTDSPLVLTLISNITILVVGLVGMMAVASLQPSAEMAARYPFIMTAWLPLLPWMLAVLAICTLFNVFGNITLSKAYQSAESSFLAPFDYSYLVFAAFWGFVFWRDIPSPMTIAGMVMIATSGVFVAWRERQLQFSETRSARVE